MANNKPEKTIRVGRGIKASIWLNSGANGTWRNVTISRTYKKDGKYVDTGSFSLEDLPLVEKSASLAFAYIHNVETAEDTDAELEVA